MYCSMVKKARIKQLPPTITAKYHFKNSTRFTPYIGIGATAFIPWDEQGVAVKLKKILVSLAKLVLISNLLMLKLGSICRCSLCRY